MRPMRHDAGRKRPDLVTVDHVTAVSNPLTTGPARSHGRLQGRLHEAALEARRRRVVHALRAVAAEQRPVGPAEHEAGRRTTEGTAASAGAAPVSPPLPSVADLFAPSAATGRAIDALLEGSAPPHRHG